VRIQQTVLSIAPVSALAVLSLFNFFLMTRPGFIKALSNKEKGT